jgi:2-oxoglutarate dehydrogenase E1 component
MYRAWSKDPNSVHASWNAYFKTEAFALPHEAQGRTVSTTYTSAASHVDHKLLKVVQLIRAYQVRGHYLADLDPLKIARHGIDHGIVSEDELSLETFGLTEADLDLEFDLSTPNLKGFQESGRGKITLRKLFSRLDQTYKGTVGVEYMHITSTEECNFLRERLETPEHVSFSKEEKIKMLERLMWADHYEKFVATKYPTAKRFGLEGGESLIPGMKALIDDAADLGVSEVVMGMPHRGRLNVLTNVVRKPLEQIFSEFSGGGRDSDFEGSGDVKYHLGMSHDRTLKGGKVVHLTLVANPSHLEAVNPVVTGKVRAKQFFLKDSERTKVMPVLLHGDAAFAGQGVVYETMGFAELPDYAVGGTVHLVVNNQVGFTTDPMKSRSNAYCSDIAKAFGAPVFHVNGEDVEGVVRVCKIASEWRQKFQKDVVIDLVCYRKYGHNEIDEPKFTQPLMYDTIAKKKSILEVFSEKLIAEGTITKQKLDEMSGNVNSALSEKFEASKTYKGKSGDWLSSRWTGFKSSGQHSEIKSTGVPTSTLKHVGSKLVEIPSDFNIHPRLKMIVQNKAKMIESGENVDWGTAEALAFGSLLLEDVHVRLSGQDVERGTFSHRHAVLHDQKDKNRPRLIPLSALSDKQAPFTISNSSLSEFGVLGFELGYSLESPNQLVIWEAQFGDFVNGAQIIIDQFISSGESKWMRQSGLTLLLPHGYEGQGPEHSSCRIERFLQMSNDDEDVFPDMESDKRLQIQKSNWQVLNCSTPANYFHALRRQVHREFRKPLVIATPKSLLRHKLAVSSFADMAEGSKFKRLIPDDIEAKNINPSRVRKLVFCSGKVYYDLEQARLDNGRTDVAIARIEQISPFPFDKVLEEAKKFPKASIVWVQEEPKNAGAWFYAAPRIRTALRDFSGKEAQYVGRPPSASPATGYSKAHKLEHDAIINKVFD